MGTRRLTNEEQSKFMEKLIAVSDPLVPAASTRQMTSSELEAHFMSETEAIYGSEPGTPLSDHAKELIQKVRGAHEPGQEWVEFPTEYPGEWKKPEVTPEVAQVVRDYNYIWSQQERRSGSVAVGDDQRAALELLKLAYQDKYMNRAVTQEDRRAEAQEG